MELGDWDTSKDVNEIYADVRRLGLEHCIAEHDAFGFTVIPPDKVAPPEFNQRLRQAILDSHARRTGERIDIRDLDKATIAGPSPRNTDGFGLIGEDPAFEEALMNPVVHTMARYFLGKSVLLSDMNALIKRTDPAPTHFLHTDQHGTPPPLPQYLQTLNVTWTLTDYSREEGSVALVPGSHRWGHKPRPHQVNHLAEDANVKAIPINCPAGSLIIWGGTTWHGSYPRSAPGLRMTLIFVFSRVYMKQIRDMQHEIAQEVIARNSPEFARLLGMECPFPHPDGYLTDPKVRALNDSRVPSFIGAGRSQWA